MQYYAATPEGHALATHTGLDDLAVKLHENEDDNYSPVLSYLTQDYFSLDDDRDDLEAEVQAIRSGLTTYDELRMFNRAMTIDPDMQSWRHLGDLEGDTLFPARSLIRFANASSEDRFILSGVAGLSLGAFGHTHPLLARGRHEEYGFQSFNEACAFVGAYVTGRLIELDMRELRQEEPSFRYSENDTMHTVCLTGSVHGDFRITETTTLQTDIVSPIQTMTEFCPIQEATIAGYHSIEPEIIATLIEAEYIRNGKAAATQLVQEFEAVLAEATDDSGDLKYNRGPFADYGNRECLYSLTSLELLLTDKSYHPLQRQVALHSSPYLPQSSKLFEIVPTQAGVQFQNREKNQELATASIKISREQYTDLFRGLVGQTSKGLGRTAPMQLAELVVRAKSMLQGKLT